MAQRNAILMSAFAELFKKIMRKRPPIPLRRLFPRPSIESVKVLLAEAQLPASDLTIEHLKHFFGCGRPDRLRGVIGLEIYGSVALLRSLAVAAEHRGRGYGKQLVAKAEEYARCKGVQEIYLLTTTADRFFNRLGYNPVLREIAPEPVRQTNEFSQLCPSTSTLMMKRLSGERRTEG